jgi:hypothetical protein
MERRRRDILIRIGATAALLLAMSLLAGCPKPCCPEIRSFAASPNWVCRGTAVDLAFGLVFLRESEPCEPSPGLIQVSNTTTQEVIPGQVADVVQPGVYKNRNDLKMTIERDSEIELRVSGDADCGGPAVSQARVDVVDAGDSHLLCCKHTGEPTDPKWGCSTTIFGPGIRVDRVANPVPNPTTIGVTHNHRTAGNLGPNQESDVHRDENPNGDWIMEVPNPREASQFVRDNRDVCVRIFLACP